MRGGLRAQPRPARSGVQFNRAHGRRQHGRVDTERVPGDQRRPGLVCSRARPAGRRGYSGERVSTGQNVKETIMSDVLEFEAPYGNLVAAQWFAQAAQRHMYSYGTTSEQLGHVAVTMREHANLNPGALMHRQADDAGGPPELTHDHDPVPAVRLLARIRRAGAVGDTSAERARDLAQAPVYVSGIGEAHGYPPTSSTQKPDMAVVRSLQLASAKAFAMADVTARDLDCLLIHEGFTWYVIAGLEALGVVKPGEGGPFVAEGHIRLGGTLPVNPNGGALSEGHVSGMNHLVEAVRQLRGEMPPPRRVPGCGTVAVATKGNFFDASVVVLRGDTA